MNLKQDFETKIKTNLAFLGICSLYKQRLWYYVEVFSGKWEMYIFSYAVHINALLYDI